MYLGLISLVYKTFPGINNSIIPSLRVTVIGTSSPQGLDQPVKEMATRTGAALSES
jgi:hypothetical protein